MEPQEEVSESDEKGCSHDTIKIVINVIWRLNNFLVDALNVLARDCDFIDIREI